MRRVVVTGIDVEKGSDLIRLFAQTRPEVVINCIGSGNRGAAADDPLTAIPVNAVFPHRLARLCAAAGARLLGPAPPRSHQPMSPSPDPPTDTFADAFRKDAVKELRDLAIP